MMSCPQPHAVGTEKGCDTLWGTWTLVCSGSRTEFRHDDAALVGNRDGRFILTSHHHLLLGICLATHCARGAWYVAVSPINGMFICCNVEFIFSTLARRSVGCRRM